MLYGRETWYLRENETGILKRTEKAMTRAMRGIKLIEKRRSQEFIRFRGLKDTLDGLARASRVRWYGHVLRSDNDDILKERWIFKWRKEDGVGDRI